jgi:SAM-dependent methyltransferase
MREPLIAKIRGARCRAEGRFELEADERDEREVRSGTLSCRDCGHRAAIERGVVDLMPDPPELVRREAAGLERFAATMRADGWDRARILRLPHDELPYWRGQALQFERALERVDPQPGQSLLDVGSNTCWASNAFAQRGLEVVALDITTTEIQGLFTADWWIEAGGVHFERVLSTMFDPALASGSFDWVFCCEVLHHNSPGDLGRTFRELYRVLKPRGTLLVLNEGLRFPTNLKHDHGAEVAEYEGNENVYFAHRYLLEARRAGFEIELLEPAIPFFTGEPLWLTSDSSLLGSTKVYAQQLMRRTRGGRRAYLWWTTFLGPDGNLSMVCRKPG